MDLRETLEGVKGKEKDGKETFTYIIKRELILLVTLLPDVSFTRKARASLTQLVLSLITFLAETEANCQYPSAGNVSRPRTGHDKAG
jgi:hypothetical protein